MDPQTGNARLDEGLPVLGYKIVYLDANDGEVVLVENTGSTETQYTDPSVLAAGTTRTYRVYTITLGGVGTEYDEASATSDSAMVPSAPRNLEVGLVTDSEINLMWDAPANNGGAAIDGWIVEKAYGGSFLDEERTNTDAFTDAQTWWDGLDCAGRVMAVMDSGTADGTNAFCEMYADLDDASEAEVERVFARRYFIIDDPAHMTYRLYNLPPETERMFRVAATNAAGLGMWTEGITATTLVFPPVRTAPSGLDVTVSGTTVSFDWTDGASADEHTVGLIDLSDYSVPHTDTVANGVEMHEYTNVTPGRYLVAVLASPWTYASGYHVVEIIEESDFGN